MWVHVGSSASAWKNLTLVVYDAEPGPSPADFHQISWTYVYLLTAK